MIHEEGLETETRPKLTRVYLENADWNLEKAFEDYTEDMKREKQEKIAESRFSREHLIFNKDKELFTSCFQVK